MTQQDTISRQLLDLGFSEVDGRSKKYRIFQRPEVSRYIYVGRKGATRYGNNLSESYSVNNHQLIINLQRKFM